jgi:hypothetical protein
LVRRQCGSSGRGYRGDPLATNLPQAFWFSHPTRRLDFLFLELDLDTGGLRELLPFVFWKATFGHTADQGVAFVLCKVIVRIIRQTPVHTGLFSAGLSYS